jgi:hypothetical protein
MIAMGVRVEDGRDRPRPAMLPVEFQARAGAFDRGQRVDHDHAGLALDQGHVGEIETSDLIDAVADLEQAVVHVELRLPPEAWIDRRGRAVR